MLFQPIYNPHFSAFEGHAELAESERYHKLQPNLKTTDELKVESRLGDHKNTSTRRWHTSLRASFSNGLAANIAVAASGGHFEHLQ